MIKPRNPNSTIKETREALEFLVAMANATDQAAQDGFTVSDATFFIPALLKAPEAFKDASRIPGELAQVYQNPANFGELVSIIQQLDIRGNAAEEITEQALISLLQINNVLQSFRAVIAKHKTPAPAGGR